MAEEDTPSSESDNNRARQVAFGGGTVIKPLSVISAPKQKLDEATATGGVSGVQQKPVEGETGTSSSHSQQSPGAGGRGEGGLAPQLFGQFSQSDLRSNFLADWNAATHPFDSRILVEAGNAIEFAQTVIKSGFILNGGALVAVPAFVTMFSIDARGDMTTLLQSGGLFVVGLLAMWLAAGCGYFATLANALVLQEQRRIATRRLHDFYNAKASRPSDVLEEEHRASNYNQKFLWSRAIGIVLSIVSFVAFVIGVYFGTRVLLNASLSPPPVLEMPQDLHIHDCPRPGPSQRCDLG
jgi:hypothetical protein